MKKNQGTVLIFILGISATLAAILLWAQSEFINTTKRVKNYLDYTEAKYFAFSGHQFAHRVLMDDLSKSAQDHLGERWANYREEQEIPVAGGTISLRLRDANSIVNINEIYTALTNKDQLFKNDVENFARTKKIRLAHYNRIKDWIDNDDTTSPNGAEKGLYLRKEPSYIPANKYLTDITELKLIDKYRPEDYYLILEYFTALPKRSVINVNTMEEDLFRHVFSNASNGKINSFLTERKNKPAVQLIEFKQKMDITELPKSFDFSTYSPFFILSSKAKIHGQTVKFKVLYQRHNGRVKLRRLQWH